MARRTSGGSVAGEVGPQHAVVLKLVTESGWVLEEGHGGASLGQGRADLNPDKGSS